MNTRIILMGKLLGMALVMGISLLHGGPFDRRDPTVPTLTVLPPFPSVPADLSSLTDEQKKQLISDVIDHKLSTYPKTPYPASRLGKFSGTGLYPNFVLKDDQLKSMARAYSHNNLSSFQSPSASVLKTHNPGMKIFLYFDSGIHPEKNLPFFGDDVGNVDDQNIDWILVNHPDWLLRDVSGNPIRSAPGTLSYPGEYWPDPGNREFQDFYAAKVKKVLDANPGVWDGLQIDQFFGCIENYTGYAGTNPQVKYTTDAAFQAAQISFLTRVREVIGVPIVSNLDGSAVALYPDLLVRVAEVGGGVENEVFPFESSEVSDTSYLAVESLKELIDSINRVTRGKYIRLNSKPGGMAGDVDRTIYAFCNYLLVAGPDREINWTFKEGDSSIPHYWFKEFDLELGLPQEEMQVIGTYTKDNMGRTVLIGDLWKRDFAKATVLVNPRPDHEAKYLLGSGCYNVLGQPLVGEVTLKPLSAMLVIKDLSILPTSPAHPIVGVQFVDPVASESGSNPGSFNVTRENIHGDTGLYVFFNLTGTAQNGVDFQSVTNLVYFPPGVTNRVVEVLPLGDGVIEGSESVTLTLLPSLDHAVGPMAQATVSIWDQAASSIKVSPSPWVVAPLGNQMFSAVLCDQFGDAMTAQPPGFSWSVNGGGTVDGTGLFRAGAIMGGPWMVTASAGGFGGSADISIGTDSNADGLPDEWQLVEFGPGFAGDPNTGPSGDPDGDRFSNLQEYKAFTKPLDRASHLAITSQHFLVDGTFEIQWKSKVGLNYQIEASVNGMVWAPLLSLTVTSDLSSWIDDTVPVAGKKYYRIKVP